MAIVQWSVPIFSLLARGSDRVAHRLSFVRRGGSATFNLGAINLKLVKSREWPGLVFFLFSTIVVAFAGISAL
jgi:hypothetical protein